MAVDAHGNPVRMFGTAGTTADCTQAGKLIKGRDADTLIADKGDDTDEVVDLAKGAGMQAAARIRSIAIWAKIY